MDLDLGFDRSDNSDDDSSRSGSNRHRSESGESHLSRMSAVSGFTTDGEGNLSERARSDDGGSEYGVDLDQLGLGLEEPDELFEELDVEVVDEDWGDDDRDDTDTDTGTSTLVPMDQEDDDVVEIEPPLLDAQNGLAASGASTNGNGILGHSGSEQPTLTPVPSTSSAAPGAPVAGPANICEKCSEPTEFCHCDDTSVSSSDEAAVAKLPLTGPSLKCKICSYKSKTFASKKALDEHVRKWHPEVNQIASTVTAATVRVPVGKNERPARKRKKVLKKKVATTKTATATEPAAAAASQAHPPPAQEVPPPPPPAVAANSTPPSSSGSKGQHQQSNLKTNGKPKPKCTTCNQYFYDNRVLQRHYGSATHKQNVENFKKGPAGRQQQPPAATAAASVPAEVVGPSKTPKGKGVNNKGPDQVTTPKPEPNKAVKNKTKTQATKAKPLSAPAGGSANGGKPQPDKTPALASKPTKTPALASAVLAQREKRVRVPNKRMLGGETKIEATKVNPKKPQPQPPPKSAPPAARMSSTVVPKSRPNKSPYYKIVRKALVQMARANGRRQSRQHPKPRDFKCDLCGKEYNRPSNLKRHKKSSGHSKKEKEEAVKGATSAKVMVTRLPGRGSSDRARLRENGRAPPPPQEDHPRQRPCPLSRRQLPTKGIAKSSTNVRSGAEAAVVKPQPQLGRGKRQMPKTKTSVGKVQPEAKPAMTSAAANKNRRPSQGTVTLTMTTLTSGIVAGTSETHTTNAPPPPPAASTFSAPQQAPELASPPAPPPAPTIEPTTPAPEIQMTPQQSRTVELDFMCIRCGRLISCNAAIIHSRRCHHPRPIWYAQRAQPSDGLVSLSPQQPPPPPVVSTAGQAVSAAVAAATAQINRATANATGSGVVPSSSKRVIPGTGPGILIPTKKMRTTIEGGDGNPTAPPTIIPIPAVQAVATSSTPATAAAAVPSTSLASPRTSDRINARRERQRQDTSAKFGTSMIGNSKTLRKKVNRKMKGDPDLKCDTCGTEFRGSQALGSLKRHQNCGSHLKKVAESMEAAARGATTNERDEDDDEEMEEDKLEEVEEEDEAE